jgi:aldoxime dehydratase
VESAIPSHLQVTRTRHRRVPEDYQPPYPAFVARHDAAVKQVVMAYFGGQHEGVAPPAFAAALV